MCVLMDKKLAKELCQDKKNSLFISKVLLLAFHVSLCIRLKGRDSTKMAKGCGIHRILGKCNIPDSKDIHTDKSWFLLINVKVAPTFYSLSVLELRNWEEGWLCPTLSQGRAGSQSGFCSPKIKGFQLSVELKLSLGA